MADDESLDLPEEKSDDAKEKLTRAINEYAMFNSLSSYTKGKILDALHRVPVKKDHVVINKGDPTKEFYIIESGSYKVTTNNQNYLLEGSGSFGEVALMFNTSSDIKVVAVTDGVLWALNRDAYKKLLVKGSHIQQELYVDFLKNVPILSELTRGEQLRIADAITTVEFNAGDRIITQGDVGDGMYFIEAGEVQVSVNSAKGEVPVKILRYGDYFGELALINKTPRKANVTAITHVKLAFLDVDSFERLLGNCVDIMNRNRAAYDEQIEDAVKRFSSK